MANFLVALYLVHGPVYLVYGPENGQRRTSRGHRWRPKSCLKLRLLAIDGSDVFPMLDLISNSGQSVADNSNHALVILLLTQACTHGRRRNYEQLG
jgi:hypothetical protein